MKILSSCESPEKGNSEDIYWKLHSEIGKFIEKGAEKYGKI